MSKPKRTFVMKVVGVTYKNRNGSDRQQIISRMRTGNAIHLVWEKGNPHSDDDSAVAVFNSNWEQVGYLPDGHRLASQVRRGLVTASVKDVYGGPGCVGKLLGSNKSFGCVLFIHIWDDPQGNGENVKEWVE